MLAVSPISPQEKIYVAAALLRITGNSEYLKETTENFFSRDYRTASEDMSIIADLEDLGPSALEITPVLKAYAMTVTSSDNSNRLRHAIQAIDPEGKYAKP